MLKMCWEGHHCANGLRLQVRLKIRDLRAFVYWNVSVSLLGKGSWIVLTEMPALFSRSLSYTWAAWGSPTLPATSFSAHIAFHQLFQERETSVLHSQVSPPLPQPQARFWPGSLAVNLPTLLLFTLTDFLLSLCPCKSLRDSLQRRNISVITNGLGVAGSISNKLNLEAQFILKIYILESECGLCFQPLENTGEEREPRTSIPPFSKMWCWARHHAAAFLQTWNFQLSF